MTSKVWTSHIIANMIKCIYRAKEHPRPQRNYKLSLTRVLPASSLRTFPIRLWSENLHRRCQAYNATSFSLHLSRYQVDRFPDSKWRLQILPICTDQAPSTNLFVDQLTYVASQLLDYVTQLRIGRRPSSGKRNWKWLSPNDAEINDY